MRNQDKTFTDTYQQHHRLRCISLISSLIILLSMVACSPTTTTEVATSAVPQKFTELCATCHGKDLKGEIAQSLLDGSWQFGSRRNDIMRSIKFGHPHHGMPSWGMVLEDEEIDTLVSYLLKEEQRLGLTKAPIPDMIETQDYNVEVEIVAQGLEIPWSMAFTGLGDALITEREGRLRIYQGGQLLPDTVVGIPKVRIGGQGGLFDVKVDPKYDQNGWVYLAFSHAAGAPDTKGNIPGMTKIVRGKITDHTWSNEQVLFEAPLESYRTSGAHFGGRIVFDPEGFLFFSIGDRGAGDHAQDLSKPNGKIHRIHRDGSIPRSNPFYNRAGAMRSIYSYGHRNPQGLAVHPVTGQIWNTEHGPLGGDEVNLILPGRNYGWPVISYGINYNGEVITELTRKEGMEQPVFYWKPSIAACGLDFYSGDLFPKWNNQLLAGALKFEEMQMLDIEKDRVMYCQTLLKNAGRVRSITVGPDGAIYVLLNNPGSILKLSPEKPVM